MLKHQEQPSIIIPDEEFKEEEEEEDIVIRSTDPRNKHPELYDAVKKEMKNHDYNLDEWDFEAKLSSDKKVDVTIYKKTSDFETGWEWDDFEFIFSGEEKVLELEKHVDVRTTDDRFV